MTRVLGVCLAVLVCGCALPRDVVRNPLPAETQFATLPSFTPTPFRADPTGDPEKTLAYWKKLKDVMERKQSGDSYNDITAHLRRSVNDIRSLPGVGVDAELLDHAEALARYCQHFLTLIEFAHDNPATIRRLPGYEKTLTDSGHRTMDVSSQARGLRAKLSQRYGTEFPAVKEPG